MSIMILIAAAAGMALPCVLLWAVDRARRGPGARTQ
jgi:hypothetical protein